ncbi:MAG TPA: Fur family transcriptional regulator [Melioribacteraceae bacterium]|nr:Fur family transcriptional regulator [Melioribacteraceae bacterium]
MEILINTLKKAGYKITNGRKSVLKFLVNAGKPVSLKDIQNELYDIDFASIYRIINLFLELKIVRKVNFGEKYLRYELEGENYAHHHHIVCTKCGCIKRIDFCFVDKLEKETNYKILDHNMEFFGICPKCLKD